MSLNNPVLHEGYVPAYQMSAVPFVTASTIVAGDVVEISFPQVTRFFTLKNISGVNGLCISFTRNGLLSTNKNYFTLNSNTSFREEMRTTKLFLSNSSGSTISYELIAGLTNIPATQFLLITGSNGYASVG